MLVWWSRQGQRQSRERSRKVDLSREVDLGGPANQHTNLKDWSKDGKRERCKVQADGLCQL